MSQTQHPPSLSFPTIFHWATEAYGNPFRHIATHRILSSVLRTVAFTERGGFPIESRPHFSFHAVMPATGFKSKRHRSHRKRNTWANTADSVLRIVQHGLAKTTPALPRFFMATCLCSIGIRRFCSCGSHEPFAPKKWLPQCLGEPPNRPS